MKRLIMTLATALVLVASANAQDDNRTRERRQMDPAKMIQMRTEHTAKQYNLDEAQTAKLLDLNTKYSQTMFRGMGQRGGQGMRQGQRGGQRGQMTDEQRAEFQKRREEMQKQMEAYNTELKSIMTEEQYKKYQDDMQKFMQRFGNRGQRQR